MILDGFQPQGGDRQALSFEQRELLENTVLPAARRWLRIPGLKRQGETTLAYWGEPFAEGAA